MSGYNFPILSRLSKGVNEMTSRNNEVVEEQQEEPTETKSKEEDAVREERILCSILEVSRRQFFEMGLVGSIDVSRSLAIYTSSISCEVDGYDISSFDEELKSEKDSGYNMFEKRLKSAVCGAIRTLRHRARAYRNKPYRKDLTLTCGVTISDPFLGLVSTSVQCSATVESLLKEIDLNGPVNV